MGRGKINKIVGKISDEVADKYNLDIYRNQDIVQSLDLYIHIAKHAKEFESVDSYNKTVQNIPSIIKNPLFVYYDADRNSLLYFKELDKEVCIVVKLNLRKNKDNYVSTLYPVNKNKIQKYIEKSYTVK